MAVLDLLNATDSLTRLRAQRSLRCRDATSRLDAGPWYADPKDRGRRYRCLRQTVIIRPMLRPGNEERPLRNGSAGLRYK